MKRLEYALLVFLTFAGMAFASQELTAEQVVEKANYVAHYQGKDFRADLTMTIVDGQGNKMQRSVVLLRRDVQPTDKDIRKNPAWQKNPELCCKGQRYYIYFPNSPSVEAMIFTFCQCNEEPDIRWVYIPSLDLVKRMCTLARRTSLLGTDFYYEDVGGRNIHADYHKIVGITDKFYILKGVPKIPQSVEFSYYKTWVHKKTFVPVKIEYFDKNNKKYREYTTLKVEKIQNYNTITSSQITDLQSGRKTIFSYSNIKYDVGMSEQVFTERYLRKLPMKYLRSKSK